MHAAKRLLLALELAFVLSLPVVQFGSVCMSAGMVAPRCAAGQPVGTPARPERQGRVRRASSLTFELSVCLFIGRPPT